MQAFPKAYPTKEKEDASNVTVSTKENTTVKTGYIVAFTIHLEAKKLQ